MLDSIWEIFRSDTAVVISVLSLAVSGLALWVSFQRLKVAKGSLELQERALGFGREFAKGKLITDGSLLLNVLQVTFTGPEDNKDRILASLLHQSAFEVLLTIENHSNSDAFVRNLFVIPRFLPGMSRWSWFERTSFARSVLRKGRYEGGVSISLKDREILSAFSTSKTFEAMRDFGRFQDRCLWHISVYDADTHVAMYDAKNIGEGTLFSKPIVIPRDGRKRVWRIEFKLDFDFYRKLLRERRVFLSGVTFVLVTDLGNLRASLDYDTRWVAELFL